MDDLRQLAGQLIMVRLFGTELDEDTAAFLKNNRVRGACLFRQNMTDAAQLTRLTAGLRDVMGPQALIALDQEGGAVVRSTWVPAPPSAMALGAANDPELAREVGAAVARAVRSLGFNWNFAPVLDLNNNPHNPVIAERSFGADPDTATRIALAWMAGSELEGVACCVKHFPGHGDTHVDSHRALPTVDKPLAELERFEFAPFRMAAQGTRGGHPAPAMMTAHIVYPALDADYPATMSRTILSGILREQWNYQGVVITDGMDMHAIAHRYGVGQAAVRALVAGADMVMAIGSRENQEETVAAIAAAIESGELPLAEVEARLARLDKLAAAYPAGGTARPAAGIAAAGVTAAASCEVMTDAAPGAAPGPDEAPIYSTDDADRALMARAWQRGLSSRGAVRRPAPGARIRLVARQDVVSDGVSEAGVPAAAIAASLAQLFEVELVTFADPAGFDWRALPQDGRFTILASTSRRRYDPALRASWHPDLHLALWNPYQALDFDAPALMTYGFAAPALAAVNAWLAGEIEASGQCPVPGF
ncbi:MULTISPECIES: beta-N-acetylhexosaminidase [unclassified Massilia]|uniref:beta-N-acetylhexosaminidase n=1 Tax=unclassified Massilia TaxID=2609279 RepID=UPI00177EA480|nr:MULTISPECIES: beta-N-acetylhexosaminidase [unclassified Massilia]MBD8531975.1 beta-N-acetylhexosaminidase [Massilia sp. CFBP 13647]MBD8675411.1 beta-N-acetylhexosaminidase [Massilia sp. CFBP 13721]